MKTCLLLTLVGLAISFAMPTFAQEQSSVDPETRQQIEAAGTQLIEVYNKHDAAAVAAQFTQGTVRMGDIPGDFLVGREAIEKGFEGEFPANFPPIVGKILQMYAFEDRIVTISEWSLGSWHGHSVKIRVRDADTWKIGMEFITATQKPR